MKRVTLAQKCELEILMQLLLKRIGSSVGIEVVPERYVFLKSNERYLHNKYYKKYNM